jgi:hypothetical protein
MESNFDNREFEQYVKKNADQYRMIPSEKVWKGISNTLHTRRRWYGLGLTLLLLLTAVSVTWVMVSYPVSKNQEISSAKISQATSTPIQPVKPDQAIAVVSKDISNILPLKNFNKQAIVPVGDKLFNEPATNNFESDITFLTVEDNKISDPGLSIPPEKSPGIIPEKKAKLNHDANIPSGIIETFHTVATDKKTKEDKSAIALPAKKTVKFPDNYYPLSIESVVNSYYAKKVSKKVVWQLYFAPTISYRKLNENKSFQNSSSTGSGGYPFASLTDINRAVTHKPDMGLELGFAAGYPLTKNLKIRGGLQFNINRYDIKAFVYNGEQATINLSGGNNDYVTAWTYYRNYNGYKSDWLKNFYFSVSAPVGAELTLFGNKKTSLGIAGTVQPTYILKDRAYLISTDYKNYAEVPRLIRHVNVNTSFETFVSYTSRNTKTRWQIGPQVRYQVLSSFQNKYPVKENLFDFGLKVGITLNP